MRPVSASGWVARHMIQAAIIVIYPRDRVKMFGMSVGVTGGWAISYVQVRVSQYDIFHQSHFSSEVINQWLMDTFSET